MLFESPWWMLGLVAVAAAATWAMFRPGRQLVEVGSLSLWEEALASLEAPCRRRFRRVTAGWVLLLCGATMAALAAARPVLSFQRPRRKVAVAVCPSAELAGEAGTCELHDAVRALLERLDDRDEVLFLIPRRRMHWSPRAQALEKLASIHPMPVPAAKMSPPGEARDAQHVYHFAPAGTDVPVGPSATAIFLPTHLPPVTIDALAACDLPDGRIQLFVALLSATGGVRLNVTGYDAEGRAVELLRERTVQRRGGRLQAVLDLAPAEALMVEVVGADEAPGAGAKGFLVRRPAEVRAVAMIGTDDPMLRRFIDADPSLCLVADAADAALVVAVGAEAPVGKPALVVNPPRAPGGWRKDASLENVTLLDANVAADDPIMRDVDVSHAAVRRAVAWSRLGAAAEKPLLSVGAKALVLRTRPEASPAPVPRRVYVTFDLGAENTNLSMSPAFIGLLANVVRWLAPDAEAVSRYEYTAPSRGADAHEWKPVTPSPELPPAGERRGLPWPGIYRDPTGRLHAVSLVGLRRGAPDVPPAQAVAQAPLPQAQLAVRPLQLWHAFAVLAVLLWLIGWALRLR